jgi:hypothetical protein
MELDSYSRDFADHFFQVFPEWRPLARVHGDESSATGYLVVEVPLTPESRMAEALCVSTVGDEVTVFVDTFHHHFAWPADEAVATDDDDPIIFVREIVAEAVIVVSWWNGDEWLGSELRPVAEIAKPFDRYNHATQVRVRSWNGTFNRDVTCS